MSMGIVIEDRLRGSMRHLQRPQPQRDVPYVPTDEPVVEAIMRLAGVGRGDVLYDLGCGDGRMVIAAAQRGAHGVGVDIDVQRIRECYWNARQAGVGPAACFIRDSLFNIDLGEASVVTLYLLPSINLKLRPRLLWELRPGSRIVSNYFDMGDWPPDQRLDVHQRTLYLWIVPAWLSGRWRCVIDARPRRLRMSLRLGRRYQKLRGSIRLGREQIPIIDGLITGRQFVFTAGRQGAAGLAIRCTGHIDQNGLRGTIQLEGPESPPLPWGGTRH